ncbi:MAG: hypothetical protein CM15mP59_1770 [Flavobacteriaceae bacterium]|nr:MAG: hypothetical protein CM15mP59_1770 [Flavobacteriaceae bacterium]
MLLTQISLAFVSKLLEDCENALGRSSQQVFWTMMDVQLCNDGPVTILMD